MEQYDLTRTLRMAGYGALIVGPSLHFWFNFLSRCFPKRDVITTCKKIVMGQTMYGPAINCVFFSMNAVAQGTAKSRFKSSVLLSFNFNIRLCFYCHYQNKIFMDSRPCANIIFEIEPVLFVHVSLRGQVAKFESDCVANFFIIWMN